MQSEINAPAALIEETSSPPKRKSRGRLRSANTTCTFERGRRRDEELSHQPRQGSGLAEHSDSGALEFLRRLAERTLASVRSLYT